MNHILATAIYFGAFLLLTACGVESGSMSYEPSLPVENVNIPQYAPQAEQEFSWITADGGQSEIDFNPQLDILFVIDNSDSMKSAQENLVKNIGSFTAGIIKNRMIDYHIGVISTWDSSERFLKGKKDSYGLGELRHVKNSRGQLSQKRFVSRQDNSQLLASTLEIGVAPYSQGGPENEEFFSPVKAAIENIGRGSANEDFFRPNAHLVVVFITDADESANNISPEQMAATLLDFKGRRSDKISIYGVLVDKTDSDQNKDWALRVHPTYHKECFNFVGKKAVNNGKCTGFGPDRLEQLIQVTNSDSGTPEQVRKKHIMKIVSKNFGSELARMGNEIKVKTLEKVIPLGYLPRVDNNVLQIRVRYGTPAQLAANKAQVIPMNKDIGWTYNFEDNSVHLSGNIDYKYQEGARFEVKMIPVTLKQEASK